MEHTSFNISCTRLNGNTPHNAIDFIQGWHTGLQGTRDIEHSRSCLLKTQRLQSNEEVQSHQKENNFKESVLGDQWKYFTTGFVVAPVHLYIMCYTYCKSENKTNREERDRRHTQLKKDTERSHISRAVGDSNSWYKKRQGEKNLCAVCRRVYFCLYGNSFSQMLRTTMQKWSSCHGYRGLGFGNSCPVQFACRQSTQYFLLMRNEWNESL